MYKDLPITRSAPMFSDLATSSSSSVARSASSIDELIILRFFKEKTCFSPNQKVSLNDLHAAYVAYATEHGHNSVSKRLFMRYFRTFVNPHLFEGRVSEKRNTRIYLVGVKLANEVPENPPKTNF